MNTEIEVFQGSKSSQTKVFQPINTNIVDSQLQHIYATYFKPNNEENKLLFQQIDHVPQQLSQQLFRIEQNCLVINFKAFDMYYPTLFSILKKSGLQQEQIKQQQIKELLQASDMILVFNGENDRAWNVKKCYLEKRNKKGEHFLNLQWQLGFNSAVCLKNKKSSSYYQYRLLLISRQLQELINQHTINHQKQQYQQQNQQKQQQYRQKQQQENIKQEEQYQYLSTLLQRVCRILQRQQALIERVLGRYFRNYFCWMYRIKLMDVITVWLKQHFIINRYNVMGMSNTQDVMGIRNQQYHQKLYESNMRNRQILYEGVINYEHMNIHKFIGKYCNDYSAYSYIISFINKYYIQEHKLNTKQYHANTINQDKVIVNNKQQDISNKQKDKHNDIYNQFMSKAQQLSGVKLIGLLQRQMKWICQLQEYCEVVYSSKQHYKHLLMYKNHIQQILKHLSPS